MAARRPSYPQARAIAVHRDERSAATGRWLMLGLALIVGFAVVAWSGAGRGRPHAVLLVQGDGRTLVLDNQTDAVRPWDAVPFYRALYSLNETGAWIHVSARDVLRLTSN